MADAAQILQELRGALQLPAGLLAHMERVSTTAQQLANRWGADPDAAALAGFLHDVARAQPPEALLAQARELGLPVHPVEERTPLLLHGPVGAVLVDRLEPGLSEELRQAIAWHSTGRWGMTLLEKVVFLADKLEPGKQGYYQGLDDLNDLAQQDLDQALLNYLEWSVRHLMERGVLVHPATIDARNWLLAQRQEQAVAHD